MSTTRRAHLRGERVEAVEDAALHRDVERRRGLVGDQQLRPAGEADGDEHALAHPTGELVGVLVHPAGRVGDADHVEQLDGGAGGGRSGRQAVHLERLGDLVAHAHQRIEVRHRVLGHQPDQLPADGAQPRLVGADEVAALEPHLAAVDAPVRRQELVDRGRRGGLARAGLADDGERAAAFDLQRHVAHRRGPTAAVRNDTDRSRIASNGDVVSITSAP